MSVYLTYFQKSFKKNSAYRATVWLQVVASIIQIGIQVAIWTALIGSGSVEGITRDDMVTYAILNSAMYAFTLTNLYDVVDTRLRTGDIGLDLLRPVRYPLMVLFDQLGLSAYRVMFMVIPIVGMSALLFGFSLPTSVPALIGYVVVLGIAVLISYFIGYLIALLSFWFLTTFHFRWMIGALTTLFSGSFLPLWFFPDGWETVARLLPFQYLGFVPAATWMGQLTGDELLQSIVVGLAWTLGLMLLTRALWDRATRQLVVQGG